MNIQLLHQYIVSQGYPIDGIALGTDGSISRIDGNLTTDQLTAIQNICKNWVDPPAPDLYSFKKSLFADSTIPASAKTQLALTFPLLEEYINEAPLLQQYWSDLKSENLPWLTDTVISTVEGYSKQFNIALV